MTDRPTSTDAVVEFLRIALADGALGVPELEAKARAAGLLGNDQIITHAKLFNLPISNS